MQIIPKYQSGGGLESYFVTYQPVKVASNTSDNSNSSDRSGKQEEKQEKGQLTEKDVFNMIKDINGLPNEMVSILNDVMSTFQISELLGVNVESLPTTYLKTLQKMKIAQRNRSLYDEAYSKAVNDDTLDEIAITNLNRVVAQDRDTGKIKDITLSELQSSENYIPLTLSQVAKLRANSPDLSYDTEILSIMENGMSHTVFNKLLDQAKTTINSTSQTNNTIFDASNPAYQGLQTFQAMSDSDKVRILEALNEPSKYSITVTDKTNAEQINNLIQYLVISLPNKAKMWAALKLGTTDTNDAAYKMVTQYLASSFNIEHKLNITELKESENPTSGKGSTNSKSGDSSKEDEKYTFLSAVQEGNGTRVENRTMTFGNFNYTIPVSVFPAAMNLQGDVVADVNLDQFLNVTGIRGLTDLKAISFGNRLLSPEELKTVAMINDGGVTAALPKKIVNGAEVPDFDLIGLYSQLVTDISIANPSASPEMKLKQLVKIISTNDQFAPLRSLIDESGDINEDEMAYFYIGNGLASDETLEDLDSNNPYIEITTNDLLVKHLQTIAPSAKHSSSWLSNDVAYRGNVFIPIKTENKLSALIFSGQKVKYSTADKYEQEYREKERIRQSGVESPTDIL